MKKVLITLTVSFLLNACNKPVDETLNKRIENLQKDSVDYAHLKARIDSLTTQTAHEDSLKAKQNQCEIGECCIKIAANLKAYANNRVSYNTLSSYMVRLNQLVSLVIIPDDVKEDLISFASSYSEGVKQVPYMHSSMNAQMSSELWLALYKAKAEKIKKKLCN